VLGRSGDLGGAGLGQQMGQGNGVHGSSSSDSMNVTVLLI
jgi:hypothetical protein